MRLISEKEEEEKATEMCKKQSYGKDGYFAFRRGVEFAESKLQPQFVEFLEYIAVDFVPAKNDGKIIHWLFGNYQGERHYTTQQLFEYWIERSK